MSQENSNYSIYEGSFFTREPILDQTINILMFRDEDENEYNIFVNRATMEDDQTPENYCEIEMENMKNELPGFQLEGKLLKHELGPAKLPVVQIANRYLQDGKIVKQVQSIISLPYHNISNNEMKRVIIFTLQANDDFTEYQRKHYVQIINSFMPVVSPLNKT